MNPYLITAFSRSSSSVALNMELSRTEEGSRCEGRLMPPARLLKDSIIWSLRDVKKSHSIKRFQLINRPGISRRKNLGSTGVHQLNAWRSQPCEGSWPKLNHEPLLLFYRRDSWCWRWPKIVIVFGNSSTRCSSSSSSSALSPWNDFQPCFECRKGKTALIEGDQIS